MYNKGNMFLVANQVKEAFALTLSLLFYKCQTIMSKIKSFTATKLQKRKQKGLYNEKI